MPSKIFCFKINFPLRQLKLDGIIYLRCDPKVCASRMKKRNRSEESTVPDDYLKALHNKYDSWLADWMSSRIDENSDQVAEFADSKFSKENGGSGKVMSQQLRRIMDDTHQHVKKALNWVVGAG